MGSDFWDPLDVAVFTTWVVDSSASRFGDSSIGDTCGTISPSFFFGSVQASRLRMLVWTSNLGGNPQTLEVGGNTSTPTSLRVCFFEEAEGQKAEVGGNTAAQYSPFEWCPSGPLQIPGAAPSRFAPFFSPQNPRGGLVWYCQ